MADFLKHECGVAVIRLRKPLAWYLDRHGSTLWGFNKLFLLMEKQHNRGQDGVGIGCVKLGMPLGEPYMFRKRDAQRDSLAEVFRQENRRFSKLARRGRLVRPQFVRADVHAAAVAVVVLRKKDAE